MKTLSFHRHLVALFLAAGCCLPDAGWLAGARAQAPVQLLDMNSSVWRYNDSGADQGTAWREVSFPGESAWTSGVGLFGVEPTVPYPYPAPIRTPLVLGAGRITYYFRANFNLPQNPASVVVSGTAFVDDGAIFYVNGAEVARTRLPFENVFSTTRAQLASPEGAGFSFNVPSSALVTGDNVIAVELHQHAVTSADVVFGLSLQGTMVEIPVVLTPDEPADRVLAQGDSTVLAVAGSGVPAPAYYWYHNSNLVAGASGPALALNNVQAADAGTYFVILSNIVGTATSRVAQVTVIVDMTPPAPLYALGGDDLSQIIIPMSEEVNLDQAEDPFNYTIESPDGPLDPGFFVFDANLENGTNIVLFTTVARDSVTRYRVVTTGPIQDRNFNELPAGTIIPVATFPAALMAVNHAWSYDQSGVDPGAAWRSNTFNDASWSAGPGPLDAVRFFDNSVPPLCRATLPTSGDTVGTCLSLSNANNSAQLSAIYFRAKFNFTGDARHTVIRLLTQIDDGAVIYLNGAELCRIGMPSGPVAYGTLASRTILNAENETFTLTGAGLVQGENVLAVEVHQDGPTSPDLTMGLRFNVVLPEPPAQQQAARPRLSYNFSEENLTLAWAPPTGALQAADSVAGPWIDLAPGPAPSRHTERAGADRRFFRLVVR